MQKKKQDDRVRLVISDPGSMNWIDNTLDETGWTHNQLIRQLIKGNKKLPQKIIDHMGGINLIVDNSTLNEDLKGDLRLTTALVSRVYAYILNNLKEIDQSNRYLSALLGKLEGTTPEEIRKHIHEKTRSNIPVEYTILCENCGATIKMIFEEDPEQKEITCSECSTRGFYIPVYDPDTIGRDGNLMKSDSD